MAGTLVLALAAPLLRRRRGRPTAALLVGAALPAVAWPLRNLVVADNPLPFWAFSLGPVRFDAVAPPSGNPSVLRDLLSGTEWSYLDGLHNGLGPLWPLLLVVVVGGSLGATVLGPLALRPIAMTALVGAGAYVITPVTGGSSFQFNLRYLAPALVAGLVVAAAAAPRGGRLRLVAPVLLGLLVAAGITAEHHERVPAWPGSRAQQVAVAVAVLAAFAAGPRLRRSSVRRVPVTAALVVAGLLGGWLVQRHYLEHRYVTAGLHDDELNAFFRTVRGDQVDVLGTPETYPFFGADLTNEVRDWSLEMYLGTPQPADPCTFWREALDEPGWVAVSTFGFVMAHLEPAAREAVLGADPATTIRLDGGDDHVVYWLEGALDPGSCPAAPPARAGA